MQRLQKKVLLLLALVTCWRPRSDLGRIFASSVVMEGDDDWPSSMTLTVSAPKTGEAKVSPVIGRWEEDKDICPVFGVAELIRRTAALRGDSPPGSERLFIQTRHPFKSAAEDTLGRWVKEVLAEAGIDMTRYSPHSTRSTAATTALERGLPLDRIMEAAGWKSARTFRDHYHRPVTQKHTGSMIEALLGKRKRIEADPTARVTRSRRRVEEGACDEETVIEERTIPEAYTQMDRA